MDHRGKKTGVEKVSTDGGQTGVETPHQKNQIQGETVTRGVSLHMGRRKAFLRAKGKKTVIYR